MTVEQKDNLGDRMKSYERLQTAICLDKSLPVYARLDGRGFSKFTRGMQRPFDKALSDAMIETARFLMQQTHAIAAYTQSDEISLVWAPVETEASGFFFDAKVQKLTSVLASLCTSRFVVLMPENLRQQFPHFDCRVLNVPDRAEAANMIVWREIDARKNAISMLARHYFSHKQLQGKNGQQMLGMLADNSNVRITDYPAAFRSGTFLRTEKIERAVTQEDKVKMHIPDHIFDKLSTIQRSVINPVDITPFTRVKNKEGVLFDNQTPEFAVD